MSDTVRTDDMCGDACLGEQWGDLLLIDAFALSLPTVRVDVDQQVFGSVGCRTTRMLTSIWQQSFVCYTVCVAVKSY